MNEKDSRVVATTCADHAAGETGYVTFHKTSPFEEKLVPLALLAEAESKDAEWNRIAESTREWGRKHLAERDSLQEQLTAARLRLNAVVVDMREAIADIVRSGGFINSYEVICWANEIRAALGGECRCDGEDGRG